MSYFSLRMASREIRAAWRHFIYFFICISLGVGSLVAVSSFSANLERAIHREARTLMAGDVELRSNRGLSLKAQASLNSLKERGMLATHVSELVAMAARTKGPEVQLVELKAVEASYPFYGKVTTDPALPLAKLLEEKGVVAQESLLLRMGIEVGERIRLGKAEFTVRGILKGEPDRAVGLFSLGPRVLLSQDGLNSTGLIQPGSRVRHRYLLRVPPEFTAASVAKTLKQELAGETVRISTYEEAQPRLRRFIDQLGSYLGLLGLITLLIGGIGVGTSVQAFLKEKLGTIAILKCLGADAKSVLRIYLLQTIILGFLGSALGIILGLAVQFSLLGFVPSYLPIEVHFQLFPLPLIKGLALGLMTTLLFSLFPLLEVRHVPPALIFRREVSYSPGPLWRRIPWRMLAAILSGFIALSLWQAGNLKVGGIFIGGALLAGASLAVSSQLVVYLTSKLRRFGSQVIRQALANIYRPGGQALGVMVSVGLAVMVILALYLVEKSLLQQIERNLPESAPSFFFIDIQPDQKERLERLLGQWSGGQRVEMAPLIRSRLVSINGRRIDHNRLESQERGWYFTREYVLTTMRDLPKGNAIVRGKWWDGNAPTVQPEVSVEEESARHLGVDIGSLIVFDIQGARVSARVSSLRTVNWADLSTNFFVIFSPGSLDGAPTTYVATAQVPQKMEIPLQQAVAKEFPNVSAIHVRDVLETVGRIIEKIGLVVRFVASAGILAGIIVMVGALAATRYQRIYESILFKALGATRSFLLRTFAVEFMLLGAAGGVIGLALGAILAWIVLRFVMEIPFFFHPRAMAAGLVLTILLTGAVGFLGSFKILAKRPLQILRHE